MIQKNYSYLYSEKSFWYKIATIPENTGCSVLWAAYSLYATLREPSTPAWVKAVIIGALGYLICTIDIIPDFLPGIGLADDLSMMTLVINQIHAFMNDDIRQRVESMLPKRCRGQYSIDPTYKS